MPLSKSIAFCLSLSITSFAFGESPLDAPRPIPLTRPELKRLIEDVKVRTPRVPLPELTDKDREQLGDRADSYESRLRYHFLAGGDQSSRPRGNAPGGTPAAGQGTSSRGGFGRSQDPKMTLDNGFKVELFWIVSRANNCQYCLGHQESKLLGAGRSEDQIAALDGDWNQFSLAEKRAFAFARKYTVEPHLLGDADIVALKPHYTDEQIVEMMLSMAWNNSINRWKEGVGVPQSQTEGGYSRMASIGNADSAAKPGDVQRPKGTYLTPTSPAFQTLVTQVAPIIFDSTTGKPLTTVQCRRPPLETQAQVKEQLRHCHERTARLPLVDEAITRKLMSLDADNSKSVPNWLRLMAHFPEEGVRRAQALLDADRNTDLNPLLKAQISWVVARNDRAWYAVGDSMRRLREQGQTEDQVFALDSDWSKFSPSEQALFRVAKNLAASPVVLTDAEVAKAVELAGPAAVVQTVNYVTHRAAFDRITEAAGLPIE